MMTEDEKKRVLQVLDETEIFWREKLYYSKRDGEFFLLRPGKWETYLWSKCPFCDLLPGGCNRCLWPKISGDVSCGVIIKAAKRQGTKRPVYNAIRKMRLWVENQ